MIAVVVGPTAVGKSAMAVAVAERLTAEGRRAEIVNADSMALYRGMDIGTAKPSPAERAAVPHHVLDLLDISEAASVAQFQTWARNAIAACRTVGVLPIVVGGSALYIRAILDRFDFPGTNPALRARWEQELVRVGSHVLHARLAELDPAAAARILPGNGRRIVRALEVIELTGQPFGAELPPPVYALPDVVQIGLDIDRPRLDERIAERVDGMWQRGFVAEVAALADRGLASTPTASRALGYRQVLDHLAGRISEEEARARTVAATRRFARRQHSWFRRDPRIRWIPFDHPERVSLTLQALSPQAP